MLKKVITASVIVFTLAAFAPVSAQKAKLNGPLASRTDVKFLNDIEVTLDGSGGETMSSAKLQKSTTSETEFSNKPVINYPASDNHIEGANNLQIKYGILLNTEIELIKNFNLYKAIDEWYGTPYQFGGSTKSGIDCSAFVKAIYATFFGILLPRTTKEQYDATRQISRTALQEGDLVFFNTTGGVSHVGIYLQNNKFVHAAVSEGVMISDLDDSYWSKRFIGASRYDTAVPPTVFSQPQP